MLLTIAVIKQFKSKFCSAFSISKILGLVFGCLGVKTVQQSSYGRMDMLKVLIFFAILTISSLSNPIRGRKIGILETESVQFIAAKVWLATCAKLSPVIKAVLFELFNSYWKMVISK